MRKTSCFSLFVYLVVVNYENKNVASNINEYANVTNVNNGNSSNVAEFDLEEYENKICKHEATCHLLTAVPEPYRNLLKRDCMCDENCYLYDDCCQDSKSEKSEFSSFKKDQFECVSTLTDGNIYMKTRCSANWNKSIAIAEKCNQTINQSMPITDILLTTPVIDKSARMTYKNMFCAICHDVRQFEFWNVGFTCVNKSDYFRVSTDRPINYTEYSIPTSESESNKLFQLESFLVTISNHAPTVEHSILDIRNILENMHLNADTKNHSIWSSSVNGFEFQCNLFSKLPYSLTTYVRYCVPDVKDTCKNGSLCSGNYVSYTPTPDSRTVYKNPQCALCNGNNILSTCREEISPLHYLDDDSFYVNVSDSLIPKSNYCDIIPADNLAFELFCNNASANSFNSTTTTTVPNTTSDSTTISNLSTEKSSISEICFPRKKNKPPCLINNFFSSDQFTLMTNETVYLKAYDAEFAFEEWAFYGNNQMIFVCGRVLPRTKFEKVFDTLNNVFTEFLIKISIICILLHLLVFSQLNELQNLSGKSLASFCVALLSALLLFEIGPLLPSCEIPAAIEHYCFLSCFTWMLTMSYDVWLSLYRATSQFRTSSGKHTIKFLIYSAISWTLPACIVGTAIYFELASTTIVPCQYKPGYGKHDQCFISQRKPLYIFFFVPASIIFATNICFFASTAFMIYRSQRNTVNPNTRHDFRLYTRLALLMGLTWTLGSIVTVTNNVIIELLFSVFNMSQGIFIFFGFTFKKKVLKLLRQKYNDNTFVSFTLSSFAPTEATTFNESSRQTQSESI